MQKHMKIAGGSLFAIIFGILFGWVLFPTIVKSLLKKEMALSKKTDVRKMWEKIPFALDFKVYIFNYTNYEDVHKGAVPIVKEIGPYYFEEWKEKVELEDHEDIDTITYKKMDKFYFREDLSGPGLTGEEIVVMPHLFMLAMINSVQRTKPAMLNVVSKALNGIFENPSDVFIKVKVLDILFRGITINCARTEFAPKAVCTAMKKEAVDSLIFEPNNQYRFSLLGMRNGTIDRHVVTVRRGKKNVMDVGKVIAIDGMEEQNVWTGACNKFEGTDGTVFPPFLTAADRIESFSGDLCRSFKPWYQRKSAYRGIQTNRYTVNIGDLENDPELQCYCVPPGSCPPKGLLDLMTCSGAPLLVSMPHFYDSDPQLQEQVKGLNPDVNEHEIFIDFEPILIDLLSASGSNIAVAKVNLHLLVVHLLINEEGSDEDSSSCRATCERALPGNKISGTPLRARQRIQFNIKLLKTDKVDMCKELPDTLAPLFWVEEGFALNKTFVNMLKYQLFIPKKIVGILRWLLVVFGTCGIICCLLFHFKDDIMRFTIPPNSASSTKIKPVTGQKDNNVLNGSQAPAKIEM